MHRVVLLLLLSMISAEALANTAWRANSPHAVVQAAGDLMGAGGASVSFSAESNGESGFVGVTSSTYVGAFKEREIILSGSLVVSHGAGAAGLWIRADGPQGRMMFEDSRSAPVRFGDGAQSREVRLYVPAEATGLKIGVTLSGAGQMEAAGLSLRSAPVTSQGVSAYDMLDHAINIIQTNALQADRVDWDAERTRLLTAERKGLPAQAAYAPLRTLLTALGDRHSFLQSPRAASSNRTTAVASQAVEARLIQDIGYLLIPGLRGTATEEARAFTTRICKDIAQRAPGASAGWIVDLRSNTGGNMWPMINGLRPLLGDGDIGAFRDRDGVSQPWRARLRDGCGIDLSNSPVAVLVGPRTASSGEAVAVSFRARPATRFFGRPTAGLATGNKSYKLPDGGSLVLTGVEFLDRAGGVYPRGVVPEEQVGNDDEAIEAAAAWLRSRAR